MKFNHVLILLSILLNAAIVILGFLAYDSGLINTALTNDTTYITPSIITITLLAYIFILLDTIRGNTNNLKMYHYAGYLTVLFGIIGTIYGFWVALSGINVDSINDSELVVDMIGSLVSGMGIAIWTTLSGFVGNLIIGLNVRLMEWRLVDARK